MKRRQQQIHCHKLHRPRIDKQAHTHWIDKRKTLAPHEKSIGHSQKEKCNTDGKCVWQRSTKRLFFHNTAAPFQLDFIALISYNG